MTQQNAGGRPRDFPLIDGVAPVLMHIRIPLSIGPVVKKIAQLLNAEDPELIEFLKKKGIL